MNSWRPYPLLRLLFPFLTGIVIEIAYGPLGVGPWWTLALLTFSTCSILIFPSVFKAYRLRWISGLMINLFLMVAGHQIAASHNPCNDPDYAGREPEGLFLATVAEPPSIRKSSFKTILDIRYRREKDQWIRCKGQAAGYLKQGVNPQPLQYGDFILLHAGLLEIKDNSNPHTFNYARYLGNKNIHHQVFAEPGAWKILKIPPAGMIRKVAFQLRDRLLNILRDNQVKGKEFAVASALLLGYVEELDADLRKDYAATGAMHILSVSGMHVGIIYIFLEFLLGFLNRRKSGRFLKAVILMAFIWFYAMITGLSPCVFRSAAMLSLPILAKSLNRSPDMFNVIAASVFILLVVDPYLVLDVGFQLSYLAVAGIILLYKPIYDVYLTSAWLPDKLWSILAISLAAQIATLPITLYTFHQFPNYFMLTNLFVVPLSSLIIYVGILLMAVGAIPMLSMICAKLLIVLVWLLNSIIHFIEQLPYSTLRGIHISSLEMFLLYLIICMGFLYLMKKQISFLYLFLCVCIVLNLVVLDFRLQRLRSNRLIVYNAYRAAFYQISMQDKAIVFYDGRAMHESALQKMNWETVRADMEAHGIKFHRAFWSGRSNWPVGTALTMLPVYCSGNYIQFYDYRLAILKKTIPKGLKRDLPVDFLILSGNPAIRIADAVACFHPRQIIIDATNTRFRTMQWLKEASIQRIDCQAVTMHGAFEKEFSKDVGN